MHEILFRIADRPVTVAEAAIAFGAGVLALFLVLVIALVRSGRARGEAEAAASERAHELDDKLADLNRLQAEMTGRMQTMAEIFGSRQGDLVKHLSDRLDGLQHRVGQGLESANEKTGEHLGKLNERLAVIDAAQKNLTELTQEVVGLKDVLANKQSRGAFGQARMEAIVKDGLPGDAYEFQYTLPSGKRPDCIIRLPGDPRPLIVDSKFPLEGFTAFRDAANEDARKPALARVRGDVLHHVKDIAEKYLVAGETQDMALLFVPSEAVYADLVEHLDDVVQRAHRARVIIVSPSLLMMAIQVMQTIMRDHRMRDEARKIQIEVGKLMDDVRRIMDRVGKLETHFRQANEDVAAIRTSADKIGRRSEKIEQLDFEDESGAAPKPSLRAAE
ncbi:DNA recombination protein RmuC [Terrarubrum flagellatum]|uniref:DNA recombination protein RmuC n=1 Tax=Terrirubrum flagellatum TaxID=2895980 RepID=UPI0031456A80